MKAPISRRWFVFRRLVLLGSILLFCIAGPPASAAGFKAQIREATLDPDGKTRVLVSLSGYESDAVLGADAFALTEAGKKITNLLVEPLFSTQAIPVSVAIVMDVSGSTAGKPLADAKAAAKSFLGQLPPAVRVALVAFGAAAEVKADFTTDRAAISGAVDALVARGETALYDGIILAAQKLKGGQSQANIVVFSDGKDTVSKTSLSQVAEAARAAKARVAVVGLATVDYDEPSLRSLTDATGGTLLNVSQSAELSSAFGQIAREIASQYVLTYTGSATSPKDLDLVVTVSAGGQRANDSVTVANPRVEAEVVEAGEVVRAPTGLLASQIGKLAGLAAFFLALATLLALMFSKPGSRKASKVLKKGLSLYAKRESVEVGEDAVFENSEIGRRAVELIEKMPSTQGYQQKLQKLLERSGWPLRASEFLVIQLLAGVVLAFVTGVLAKSYLIIVPVAVLGFLLPKSILKRRVSRRVDKFLEQLPDTLQLLASSLRAGYGLMQALDTVAKEANAPTSEEFGRVLSEIRLGMQIDEALEAMADRIGSEDFRWVVVAIVIQSQVGGNLSALLESVAQTLRDRQQLRRQVQVLSAEGRLSAIILIALPFVTAGYLVVVNKEYLRPLLEESLGKLLISMGGVFMVAGVFWIRRVIKIEV